MLEAEFYACEDDSPSVFVRFSYRESEIRSRSLRLRASLRGAGGCGGTGGAVNPSLGALTKHPCLVKPPYPHTRRPLHVWPVAMEDQRPASIILMRYWMLVRYVRYVRYVRSFGNRPYLPRTRSVGEAGGQPL